METDIVIDEVKDPVIDWKQLWQTIVGWCASTGLKILISIVVLFISFKVINFIFKRLQRTTIILPATKNWTKLCSRRLHT